jgi:3'-5' exoribonuclease
MTKHLLVKDIARENLEVNDVFVVVKKSMLSTKSNTKYINLDLKDKSGTIEGKVWERADELGSLFDKNDIVQVRGRTRLYQDRLQITVTDIRKVNTPVSMEDLKDLYSGGKRESADLRKEYFALVDEIKDPHLRSLLQLFNSKSELLERFFYLPASIGVHHTYLGGLVEHTLSMAAMAKMVCPLLGGDSDIVVTGCILHDVGKIEEIKLDGGFRYTDRGRLLGHISLGIMIVEDLLKEMAAFPGDLADTLAHIVLSHHGVEEWGSPKKPMCLEAIIVHYLDNLDAKVMGVTEYMRDNMEDTKWTEFHRLYESRFYKVPER